MSLPRRQVERNAVAPPGRNAFVGLARVDHRVGEPEAACTSDESNHQHDVGERRSPSSSDCWPRSCDVLAWALPTARGGSPADFPSKAFCQPHPQTVHTPKNASSREDEFTAAQHRAILTTHAGSLASDDLVRMMWDARRKPVDAVKLAARVKRGGASRRQAWRPASTRRATADEQGRIQQLRDRALHRLR